MTIRLTVCVGSKTFDSQFIEVANLPKVGEYISTTYFQQKFEELKKQNFFKVTRILHHYVNDMSRIDYTEIELIVFSSRERKDKLLFKS